MPSKTASGYRELEAVDGCRMATPRKDDRGVRMADRSPVIDEDANIRQGLCVLPSEAGAELERVLNWVPEKPDELLRRLVGTPDLEHMATLIAIADTDLWRGCGCYAPSGTRPVAR
jgi:hypothetical protein